jgi:hypothetical protein
MKEGGLLDQRHTVGARQPNKSVQLLVIDRYETCCDGTVRPRSYMHDFHVSGRHVLIVTRQCDASNVHRLVCVLLTGLLLSRAVLPFFRR